MKNINFKFMLSICIGFVMFYLALSHYDISKAVVIIEQADLFYLLISFIFLVLAYIVRGIRWQLWEKSLSFQDSFKLILVGFMGNNIFPARFGELLRSHCASDKTHEGFGRTAALGSIFTERIFDAFIIALIALISLSLVTLADSLYAALMGIAIFFIVLINLFFFSIKYHLLVRSAFDSLNRVFPGHLTRFGKEKINYFMDGILLIESISTIIKVLLVSALVWVVELVSYYYISKALIGHISIGNNLLFLSTVNFASLFPFTVAGIGAIEGVATTYLVNAGIDTQNALAVVVSQHTMQFVFTTVFGGYFYFKGRYYDLPLMKSRKGEFAGKRDLVNQQQKNIQETRSNVNKLLTDLGKRINPKAEIPLTIVVPAYNETNRLPKTILETISWCNKNEIIAEIIVVDDGSTDSTPELGKLFCEQFQNVKFISCPHLGKGFAVKIGMLNASGDNVLFMDADGATELDEIKKLLFRINQGFDIAIGSRVNQDENDVIIVAKKHRKIIGRVFAVLVNLFAISGIGDTQCGFKMFRKNIVNEIFRRQKLNGFAFDVEILYIAKKLSLDIAEVPVNWTNQEESKVNLIVDSAKMLKDILLIKLSHKNTEW